MVVRALASELSSVCLDAKVEKVVQPEKDEVVLYLHCPNGGESRKHGKLLLSANPSRPKIHFTSIVKENPIVAPNFCMLLRKHLTGARIISVSQPSFERIIEIVFETKTELFETVRRKLVLEIMGRSSNLIFMDGDDRIYETLRPVDLTTSSKRTILSGVKYEAPPSQNKLPLSYSTIESWHCSSEKLLSQQLLDTYWGFSPLICREIAFEGTGDCSARCDTLSEESRARVSSVLASLNEKIIKSDFSPCILKYEGKPTEFSCFSIFQYGETTETIQFLSISDAIDDFYSEKDKTEHLKRSSDDIQKLLSTVNGRLVRKIAAQEKDYLDSLEADKYRQYGDLIFANIGLIPVGVKTARVIDYTNENMPEISIPLDPSLSANKNALRYYKLYKKAQTAKEFLAREIPATKDELAYIQSIADALCFAETAADFDGIREELRSSGYLHERKQTASRKMPSAKFACFLSSEGAKILVGKNNLQNDELTMKTASKNDIWFHVKNYPACHTVLFTDEVEISDCSLNEAAIIAATFCSASKSGQKLEVDYTLVKNVRKPKGTRPGMVIYENYKTAYVAPDLDLCERLRVKK